MSNRKSKGYNIIRYLLLKLRHKILKDQITDAPNNWISNLNLKNECLPFEEMPFEASLSNHNPKFIDVLDSIDVFGHEDEILARKIKINTEQTVKLFSPINEISIDGDIDEVVVKYNSRLIDKHKPIRSLIIDNDKAYISGYVNNTVEIIKDLINRKGTGLLGYENAMLSWLTYSREVDSDEKKGILQRIFKNSNLALIYGAAGTGKTTLIQHIASFFASERKLFLANTNPAKEHLRRDIKIANSQFSTIASSSSIINNNHFDIVFIDECSTVDNKAMLKLLSNLSCRLLVLVGDVYQIQSIKFGNWFGLAKYFLPKNVSYELSTPYRTQENKLLKLWDKVRKLEDNTSDYLTSKSFCSEFDGSLFQRLDDEIVLCLNYDGLYGINNLNQFLQSDNSNPAIKWDSWVYKVNDPIIFNEYNRFYPIL